MWKSGVPTCCEPVCHVPTRQPSHVTVLSCIPLPSVSTCPTLQAHLPQTHLLLQIANVKVIQTQISIGSTLLLSLSRPPRTLSPRQPRPIDRHQRMRKNFSLLLQPLRIPKEFPLCAAINRVVLVLKRRSQDTLPHHLWLVQSRSDGMSQYRLRLTRLKQNST